MPVTQRGKCQAGAADRGQHRHDDQRQSCTLQPVLEGIAQSVALGQPQGPALNPGRQVAACAAGQSIGFQIIQGAGVFFAQANGFRQPEIIQFSHAASRRSIES
ncbi:hypothetical protein PS639_06030 [Pseudomonas fluorescens]|nr:hypothetical protein PS639_06030 [Pseudomonas fluorescens]